MKNVKTYNLFILENKSIPDQIVSLVDGDSYAQSLVSQYCADIDPTVDLVSAISLLDIKTQNKILNLIKKYRLNKDIEDSIIGTHTDLNLLEESNKTIAGKNVFDCFLKVLTALGQKNIKPNWEKTPENFLIYYITDDLVYLDIRMITSRFKYLDLLFQNLSTSTQFAQLYFGLSCNMSMEYGIVFQDSSFKIGEFNFSEDVFQSTINSQLLSLTNFKYFLRNLNFNKLRLLCKIKNEVSKFDPGYYEQKTNPVIHNDVLSFGYYGIGRWDDGFMDNNEYESIKNKFRNFLIQFKWVDNVKISVVTRNLWIYLNIKIKD